MTVRELPTISESEFDAWALHPMQTFAWGEIREKTGVQVVRFGIFEGEELKETYLMTLHHIPYVPYRIGYVPRSRIPSEAFLAYLETYCRQYRIIYVQFEPEAHAGELLSPGLTLSRSPLFYRYSRVIDTSVSIDEIKKQIESGTRYNIGLAERKGVVVTTEDSEHGFNIFYNLYEGTTKRQHFGGHTKKYHETIWKVFSSRGVAHVLIARVGEVAVAACEVWLYKDTLYYTYAGSSMEERNKKPINALLWHVMLFAKKHGASKVDLWGILPPGQAGDKNDPWAGFSDFKKGYGGEVVEMVGSYDLLIFPLWYEFVQLFMYLRKMAKRLYPYNH